MKRLLLSALALLALPLVSLSPAQNSFSGKYAIESGQVVFTSESPHEKFNGVGGKDMKGWVDFDKKTFRVVVNTDDFTTGQRMRDEHMHENYIESEDYPEAVYEGVLESINPQTGETVTKGAMTIHGVTKKDVISKGILKISGGTISGNFNFTMLLSDYNIEIPSLVVMKLSNSIENNVTFTLKK